MDRKTSWTGVLFDGDGNGHCRICGSSRINRSEEKESIHTPDTSTDFFICKTCGAEIIATTKVVEGRAHA